MSAAFWHSDTTLDFMSDYLSNGDDLGFNMNNSELC